MSTEPFVPKNDNEMIESLQLASDIYVVEFAKKLRIVPPEHVLSDASAALPALDIIFTELDTNESDDRHFFSIGLTFFAGEFLSQKYGVTWQVSAEAGDVDLDRFVWAGPRRTPWLGNGGVKAFLEVEAFVMQPRPKLVSQYLNGLAAKIVSDSR